MPCVDITVALILIKSTLGEFAILRCNLKS
jgi:hypothetical protein